MASPVFSGSIPQHYDEYLGPMYFEPYAADIPKMFDASGMQKALEIGAGTGRVTNHLRMSLPASCDLIACDISPDMIAFAKEKLKGGNIHWMELDAQELPFEDNSFDMVVSCYAFMFIEDKTKVFNEVHRVLKKGGRFVLSLWDKLESNPASHIFRKIVKPYLGEPVPKSFHLPFSFYEKEEINNYFLNAGFSDISIERVEKLVACESASKAAIGLSCGGSLYNEIMNRNPAWIDEIVEKLEKELKDKFGDDPIVVPVSAVVCQAAKI